MVIYGLGLLPMIRELKRLHPTAKQTWYADDGFAFATQEVAKDLFDSIKKLGDPIGYKASVTKSSITTTSANLPTVTQYFTEQHNYPFKLCTGSRHLGGFLGEEASFHPWLETKTATWTASLKSFIPACNAHPHAAYIGVQKSLQMEWQFLQRTTFCPPRFFQTMETVIADEIIPAIFGYTTGAPIPRQLSKLCARAAGLGLFDPTWTADSNPLASQSLVSVLEASLVDPTVPFSIHAHSQEVERQRETIRLQREFSHGAALKDFKASFDKTTPEGKHAINRLDNACQTARMLSIMPFIHFDTDLSNVEFRDRLHIRYGVDPPNLFPDCDGCGKPNSISHALSCTFGGLVIMRHDEMKRRLGDICSQALVPSAVRDEPLINPISHNNRRPHQQQPPAPAAPTDPANTDAAPTAPDSHNPNPAAPTDPANTDAAPTAPDNHNPNPPPEPEPEPEPPTIHNAQPTEANPVIQLAIPTNDAGIHSQKRGDLLVRGLFQAETDVIIDIQIVNLSAPTHRGRKASTVLQQAERTKQRKYKALCQQQRRMFVPFVMSACGLFAPQASKVITELCKHWVKKYDVHYCRARHFIHQRLDVSLIRSCNLCIRGSRIPRIKNSKSRALFNPYASGAATPPGDFLFLSA
jgi:hypothetical protein